MCFTLASHVAVFLWRCSSLRRSAWRSAVGTTHWLSGRRLHHAGNRCTACGCPTLSGFAFIGACLSAERNPELIDLPSAGCKHRNAKLRYGHWCALPPRRSSSRGSGYPGLRTGSLRSGSVLAETAFAFCVGLVAGLGSVIHSMLDYALSPCWSGSRCALQCGTLRTTQS